MCSISTAGFVEWLPSVNIRLDFLDWKIAKLNICSFGKFFNTISIFYRDTRVNNVRFATEPKKIHIIITRKSNLK